MGVRVEMPSNQPIVLLREVTGERYLPIWIGAVEATAIAFAQQGVTPPRPLTHDLLKDVLGATGNELVEVRMAIEPEMTRLAVLKTTARDIERLADALDTEERPLPDKAKP